MIRATINKQGIRKLQRSIQKEFDKHPVNIPINAEIRQPESKVIATPVSITNNITVNNNGDHAQISLTNQNSQQLQAANSSTAEKLLALLLEIGESLESINLSTEDKRELLESLTEAQHDLQENPSTMPLSPLRLIRRLLQPLANAAISGTATGINLLTQKWVEQITQYIH